MFVKCTMPCRGFQAALRTKKDGNILIGSHRCETLHMWRQGQKHKWLGFAMSEGDPLRFIGLVCYALVLRYLTFGLTKINVYI